MTDDPTWGANLDEALGRQPVPSPSPSPRRDEWIRWIGAIDKDLSTMAINRMAWRALTAIWRDRQPALPPSFLFEYFAHTYAHTQAVAIRRQADRRKDVTSLAALLAAVARYPELINREFFVGRYPWGMQHLGESEFAGLDRQGKGQLDSEVAVADLDELGTTATAIREWVNKHVAHLSSSPAQTIPTFAQLDAALDVLDRIFRRWNSILTGGDLVSLEPFPQYDWLAPLREPWLVGPEPPT